MKKGAALKDVSAKDTGLPKDEDDFSLFFTEEKVILEAEQMLAHLHTVAMSVTTLKEAYCKSYQEQRRLVRLSDRMQLELHTAKQRLADQAQALLALNKVLAAEVEQRVQLTEELQKMATTDVLTGAFSRRHLFELGEHAILREQQLAVLMIDIDHFKTVNDTLGHVGGDEVLRHFADVCRVTIRKGDIFARYGGEEFVVLLPETDLGEAAEIGERVRISLCATPISTSAGDMTVTTSIGAARYTKADGSLERLLTRADRAPYRAKRAGRNRVVIDAAI
ncbi:MAG TPA: GGDEF domain-containing protein [Stellaceae bacterium]|nr:GGDEF domain-containing protein [Stellaceae bacterium]